MFGFAAPLEPTYNNAVTETVADRHFPRSAVLLPEGEMLLTPDRLDELQKRLGYRFAEPRILQQALIHRSYLHENAGESLLSNERLEFLGDAWLGYVIAAELFRRFPAAPEGVLTKLRAGVVQRETLAMAAREYGLGEYLILGQGEAQAGAWNRTSTLGSLYEAVVGALLVDGGEEVARAYILATLQSALEQVIAGSLAVDYKSALQEFCQARRWAAPHYRLESMEGPAHARWFQVSLTVGGELIGRGAGPSRRAAEKEAAREGLELLRAREEAGPPETAETEGKGIDSVQVVSSGR